MMLYYIFLVVFIILIIQFAVVFKRGNYSGKTFLGIILKSGLAALGIIIVFVTFNMIFSGKSSPQPSSDTQITATPSIIEEISPASPTPLEIDLTPSSATSSPSPTVRIGSQEKPTVTLKPTVTISLPKTGGGEKGPPIVQPKVPEAGGLGETLFWGAFGIAAFALGLLL